MARQTAVRTRVVTVVLACGVALAGCTGESDADEPVATGSSGSTPSPTTERTQSPDTAPVAPEEPTLPAAARGDSIKAAKAFVEYYIELFNYARSTGRTVAFRASASDCRGCEQYADLFQRQYRRGGYNRSKGWKPLSISMVNDGRNLIALLEVRSARMIYKEESGESTETYPAETYSIQLHLEGTNSGWAVTEFRGA